MRRGRTLLARFGDCLSVPGTNADSEWVENTHDLKVLLASRHPLVFVATAEEERFFEIVHRAADQIDAAVWTWSQTQGLRRSGEDSQYRTQDLRQALDFISEIDRRSVFVLTDAAPELNRPETLRRLREVCQESNDGQTVIVTGTEPSVPASLADVAHSWTLRPPTRDELAEVARQTLADFHARGFPIRITKGELRQLADSLVGMTERAAERAIQRAVVADGRFDASDIALVRTAKAEILNQDGILEIIESRHGSLDDIGGLDDLKSWLRLRRAVFQGTSTVPGLDIPKGILLTGIPGCGKSLAAKTIAAEWDVPLILLDPSRLYSKYVGESEQRLASALDTIDAMSPVVVWIDEIEKGFATSESDGGVSRRVLGTFLRWLQDRNARVFAVATANDVSSLPPELLRRGRFDEIFFVDLPDDTARHAILTHHLERREQDPGTLDLDALVAATAGFSGAELETVVVGALYRAASTGQPVDTATLQAEIDDTVPLSVSRAEDIARLRAWASDRANAA